MREERKVRENGSIGVKERRMRERKRGKHEGESEREEKGRRKVQRKDSERGGNGQVEGEDIES